MPKKIRYVSQLKDEIFRTFDKKLSPKLVGICQKGIDVGGNHAASIWDTYISGLDPAKSTKLPGHPISGSDLFSNAYYHRFTLGGRAVGGKEFLFRWDLWNIDALEEITSDDDPVTGRKTQPYWTLFNWGTGPNFALEKGIAEGKIDIPHQLLSRRYKPRISLFSKTKSQKQGFRRGLKWVPLSGGDRGKGLIMPYRWVENYLNAKTSKSDLGDKVRAAQGSIEDIENFKPAHYIENGMQKTMQVINSELGK